MPELRHLYAEDHRLTALALNPGAQGEPVIFIHGITGSVYFWAEDLIPAVLRSAPGYALSLPGHYPAAFPLDFRPEALTADMLARVLVSAIRDLADGQPVTLVGHSTGGFAALNVAAYAPGLVRRVISIAGFAQGRWAGILGQYQTWVRHGPLGRWAYKRMYRLAAAWQPLFEYSSRYYTADFKAFQAYPGSAALVKRNFAAFKHLDLEAMIIYFSRMPEIDITQRLGQITAPVLALTGDADPIVPPAQARLIAKHVPEAELKLIPGGGHFVFAERQAAYHAALDTWLAAHP